MFDALPAFSAGPFFTNQDELSRYLAEDVVPMKPSDTLSWWASKKNVYPRLSRMALDYLSIPGMSSFFFLCINHANIISPATSVDVERVFSHGRILLSHLRNWLSPQTTCSLMCLQAWSLLSYVKDKDLMMVA